MPYDVYPSDTDLQEFLTSTGLDIPPSLELAAKVDDAVQEWETRTGWGPYLSTGIVESRLFDPPRQGRSLYLQGGLLSLTSLAVGVVPDGIGSYTAPPVVSPGVPPSPPGPLLVTTGTPLVPNLNFYLRPQNAAVRGLPVTEVEFIYRIGGVPQSVAVTGLWGRVLQVPGDVWQAILQKAAAFCVPELSASISGGYYERKIGDSTKRYGGAADSGPLAQQETLWSKSFERVVMSKKRMTA